MSKIHKFSTSLNWEGNLGSGTSGYKEYSRNHTITSDYTPKIDCSSDPVFLGDKTKYNPEQLFAASASACHMLWYLHLCADAKVVVTGYQDKAEVILAEEPDGSGKFTEMTLHPVVTVKDKSMVEKAKELHEIAHKMCFIANSCNFPIKHEAIVKVAN